MSAVTKDLVLQALSSHVGRDRATHMPQLCAELAALLWDKGLDPVVTERQVRHLIEDLRGDGTHICAHPSSGYYIAATPDELAATCKFLRDRAMTSLKQEAAMRRVSLPDLIGQLHLPT